MTDTHLPTDDPRPSGIARRNLLRGAAAGMMTAGIPVSMLQQASAASAATGSDVRPTDGSGAGQTASGIPCRIVDTMDDDHAWSTFLGQQDLLWQKIPTSWDQGPFLGNGRQATLLYRDDSAGSPGPLRLEVCHSEVQDHRPEYWPTFGLARLPVGYFHLITAGTVTAVDWRLDLWNATLAGTITTTAGTIGLRLRIHDRRGVMIAELSPDAGERGATWEFHPLRAVADRANPAWKKVVAPGYLDHPNPEAVLTESGDVELCVQEMLAGGQTVTAWRQTAGTGTSAGTSTLYCATAHSYPDSTAQSTAMRQIKQATAIAGAALDREHEQAWHAFYRKSFLSVPDARLQSFYWIQLYKINAGTRSDAPIMTTTGPWYIATRWPCVWWDMNAQVEYLLIHGSNHLELDALTTGFRDNQANLVAQVPPQYRGDSAGLVRTTDRFLSGGLTTVPVPGDTSAAAGFEQEIGDLLWAVFCVWLSWRHSMDRRRLSDTVYPVLRRAVNYYLHFLTPGSDGRYHLAATYYPEHMFIADCSYDLELLRWGLGALLDAIKRLGVKDPRADEYLDALAKLAPQTSDPVTGLNIAPDFPLPGSQAGYNYLLAIWPLYTRTWDQPDQRELIRTSLEYFWKDRTNWLGFTYAGAASQAALMGLGDQALEFLHEQWSSTVPVTANTMYAESQAPVIESPLGAARGLHDMLCQSWGGVIRVFPAVPSTWPDVTVHDFLTEGAFRLSAVRTAGTTRWIRLLSLAGEPLLLRAGIAGAVDVTALSSGRPVRWEQVDAQTIRIHANAGDEVLVRPAGSTDELVIAPVAATAAAPAWGLPG